MTRRTWLWCGLILVMLLAAGLARLHLDVEIMHLLPAELPVVEGLQLYQKHFTDSHELILTLHAESAAEAETAARSLAQTLRSRSNLVASVLWQPAWLEHPAQAAELLGYLWLNQPPAQFNDLALRLATTNLDSTLADARDLLATSFSPLDLARRGYDPYNLLDLPETATRGTGAALGDGQSLFASGDGSFRILFVRAAVDLSNYKTCIGWIKQMHELVHDWSAFADVPGKVRIGFTGGPAFAAEISQGMEHDMTSSVGITSVIIAVLFWMFHRRIVPMLWLLLLLALILAATLALGGLIFGSINVVSLGFAGILLGLAVDYGVVHYQEALASPGAIIPEIRRAIGPSIFWAAVTTISAFSVLNFGGLPGLAQLGSLVGIGVALSALVMLFFFLPPLFRDRLKARLAAQTAGAGIPVVPPEVFMPDPLPRSQVVLVFSLSLILLVAGLASVFTAPPRMDRTANALRPRHSTAYAALDEIKTNLTGNRDPLWLILRGTNEQQIARQLAGVEPLLLSGVTNGLIASFTLPTPIWPNSENQASNKTAAAGIVSQRDELRTHALAAGFRTNSMVMTDAILDTWKAAGGSPKTFWPTNEMSRWIMEKIASRDSNQCLAVGFLLPGTNGPSVGPAFATWSGELAARGYLISGWELLGPAILHRVQSNMWKVVTPMVLLVLLSLGLAFRRWPEILLSLAVLTLSGLCLLLVMRISGGSWNLLNLMAIPLMLGSGVDYSIFMQLALRRHAGNRAAAHRSVGRALLLCGGTAVAGFGSLAGSTNAGMANLGQVCAVGIGANMLISVYLLPVWWRKLAQGKSVPGQPGSGNPSSLYCSGLWRAGQALTRALPAGACAWLGRTLSGFYWQIAPHRREIVIQNLLPLYGGDRAQAERTGSQLMRNFGVKVSDLWRFESGLPVEHLFGEWTGWEHFQAAQAQKRGILLITPHLGNWEFGGPLLTRRGVSLQVITLAEPGNGFTELRQQSRARWDIETLVIGQDPFAFVEVIRRLEAGATVALLVDRPPPSSRVQVELFGQPFAASVAAAELARASGCVLLPVYLPKTDTGYAAHILPPIPYDRAALRQRETRRLLTQEIIRVFEPVIREHAAQWYHFVPLWEDKPPGENVPQRPI